MTIIDQKPPLPAPDSARPEPSSAGVERVPRPDRPSRQSTEPYALSEPAGPAQGSSRRPSGYRSLRGPTSAVEAADLNHSHHSSRSSRVRHDDPHTRYLHEYDTAGAGAEPPPSYGSLVAAAQSRSRRSSSITSSAESDPGDSRERQSAPSRSSRSRRSRPRGSRRNSTRGTSHGRQDSESEGSEAEMAGDENQAADERSSLLPRWKRRKRRGKRFPMCGLIFRIFSAAFLVYILFQVIDDLDRNKHNTAGAPAPYLLPDGSAYLVQRFDFSPAFDSALLNDPRIAPGLIVMRREIALPAQGIQSFLFHAVGDRYSGTLTIKGGIKRDLSRSAAAVVAETGLRRPSIIDRTTRGSQEEDDPRPDEQDPGNHIAYINVTCAAKSRSALENSLTLAQIATNSSEIGITLASDLALGPADITVWMDVTLPKVLNNRRLEASAESLDIFASDISGPVHGVPGETEEDLLRLHMKDLILRTKQGTKIGTDGVIIVVDQIVISSVSGDINFGSVTQTFNGDFSLETQSGSVSVGMIAADRGTVHLGLDHGPLKSQLINGKHISIVSDSASISGAFAAKASFTATSNSGDMDLSIAPVSLERNDPHESVQTNVDVRGRTGSVQVVYTNQKPGTKLYSNVSSRVGHVTVHHHWSFQGDFDISDRDLTGLITLNIPKEKASNVTQETDGATGHIFGSVWLKESQINNDVWGRSVISSLIAPVAAFL